MDYIKYFKEQAKKLHKDYKTRYLVDGDLIYAYCPKFFPDIDHIVNDYDINEEEFTLMQAQHIIALLSGFRKWKDLLDAKESRLELGKLLLEHRALEGWIYPVCAEWEMYENEYGGFGDDAPKIFKIRFLGDCSLLDIPPVD
jgi:hypothetical protein